MATCKRLRIDPFAYLRDVFTRLPEGFSDETLRDLLPDRWAEQNPKHRLVHREKEASQAERPVPYFAHIVSSPILCSGVFHQA